MSLHLDRQIEKLKQMIISLGTLVEESLQSAIRAVDNRDPAMAQTTIDGDNQIDLMEIEIEEECLHTLALHQPVAFDLRFVVAVLKMNNDLERIADLTVNIAEQAQFLAKLPKLDQRPFDLAALSRLVQTMLKRSLDALVNIDVEAAQSVRGTDAQVDDIHRQTYRNVEEGIRRDPALTEQYIHMLNVSRQLERIADHTVNISEDVIYMAQGEILRHRGKPDTGIV